MSVDKRLEELAARTTEFCGCDTNKDVALCVHDTEAMGEVERIALPLEAALLRARVVLSACAAYENCVCQERCPDTTGGRCLGGVVSNALAVTLSSSPMRWTRLAKLWRDC